MNQVFKTKQSKKPMTEAQLKEHAGDWFTMDRIEGNHCNCNGNGKFVLLSKKHTAVVEGGKDYMVCRVCEGYSHL